MVDLVEDDEGLALLGPVPVQHRAHPDTGVRDGDAVVLLAERSRAVLGIEFDPDPCGGLRPLLLQMLGRRDHGHLLHDVVVQQPGSERQREGRLAGAGRGDGEEVTRLLLEVPLHRPLLPGTQLAGGTPGARPGKAGERWCEEALAAVVVTVSVEKGSNRRGRARRVGQGGGGRAGGSARGVRRLGYV
ncbi:hypothetical protein SAV14893_046530 [Streptomyces avermitilis]|uniref:Uncharacterized protein n=1 Tax=Streptomyces avermitilis TaxID=33903 RepID=A0A4D4LYX9_STRAX|nr:hypothetical protein SAV14893_046530 [Streptomyces avermitilis]